MGEFFLIFLSIFIYYSSVSPSPSPLDTINLNINIEEKDAVPANNYKGQEKAVPVNAAGDYNLNIYNRGNTKFGPSEVETSNVNEELAHQPELKSDYGQDYGPWDCGPGVVTTVAPCLTFPPGVTAPAEDQTTVETTGASDDSCEGSVWSEWSECKRNLQISKCGEDWQWQSCGKPAASCEWSAWTECRDERRSRYCQSRTMIRSCGNVDCEWSAWGPCDSSFWKKSSCVFHGERITKSDHCDDSEDRYGYESATMDQGLEMETSVFL